MDMKSAAAIDAELKMSATMLVASLRTESRHYFQPVI